MKVSFNWLKDYVDINLPYQELTEKLTMIGLEATDVQVIGAQWENCFTGEVVSIDPHPNADRLCLATVSLESEQHTVVCGAPNIAAGQKIAFAKLGARLVNPYEGKVQELKPAKIRGVRSEGMVCSEKELGLSDNHEGILLLAEDAPVGVPLAEYMGDVVFDITVTPNRPDCLNMIGIAREAAALNGGSIRLPEVRYEENSPPAGELVEIEIEDPDLCPRYCGAVISDVHIGPSPAWMQEKLTAAGMRPINNIVDITNFVMLEYGQPLHAFDYERINGRKIIVRRAKEGELMTTLDGEERKLNSEMLLICDADHPVAIAGVMGGEESEVTEQTKTILLESANFNNVSIRRTSRKLGLISEASSRFDKGLSRELPIHGIKRAVQLMVELAGGKAAKGIVDAYPDPKPVTIIPLQAQKVSRVLGIDFGIERIRQTLQSLGFECEEKSPSDLMVTVPYWRTDVTIAEDLVEEVARIIGYDEIPITLLSTEIPHHEPTLLTDLREQVRDILVGCGMQEVINYSLVSLETLEKIECHERFGVPVRLANPMSREQEFLRTSLRGGMLNMFAANERRQEKGLMLFEIGKVYLPWQNDLPNEPTMLCGICGGPRFEPSWLSDQGQMDFFDAKGILDALFTHLRLEAGYDTVIDDLMIPGKTAEISIEGKPAGLIGELHPKVASRFDIGCESVLLFEIEIETLALLTQATGAFSPIPRFPSTDRDLALVVDAHLPVKQIVDIITRFPQVSDMILFDVYQGKQVPQGKKSLAFALKYQSPERTLTDQEVDKIQQKILSKLEKEVGATLRQ